MRISIISLASTASCGFWSGETRRSAFAGRQGSSIASRHKLQAYRWNLVDRYLSDLIFVVTEIDAGLEAAIARFRLKTAFAEERLSGGRLVEGVVCSEPTFRISTAILEHRTPCLAFAIEEAAHVNVWKNRLAQSGLPVGPWLRELKRAVLERQPSDYAIRVGSRSGASGAQGLPLGRLRDVVTLTRPTPPPIARPSLNSRATRICCSSRPPLRRLTRDWRPSAPT